MWHFPKFCLPNLSRDFQFHRITFNWTNINQQYLPLYLWQILLQGEYICLIDILFNLSKVSTAIISQVENWLFMGSR